MAEPVTINLRHVARGLGTPLRQVEAVCELLDEGNTVPFITRYRKDQTGGLDEEHIRQIQSRLKKMRLLAERKQTILRSIESQGKLTEALGNQIRAAGTSKRLEDLYLPFKPKKQTLATLARSRGLEPLAGEILGAVVGGLELDARAADFVNPDRQVHSAADALLGAGHILAEQISENAELRQRLREVVQRTGRLICSRIEPEPKPPIEKPSNLGKAERAEKRENRKELAEPLPPPEKAKTKAETEASAKSPDPSPSSPAPPSTGATPPADPPDPSSDPPDASDPPSDPPDRASDPSDAASDPPDQTSDPSDAASVPPDPPSDPPVEQTPNLEGPPRAPEQPESPPAGQTPAQAVLPAPPAQSAPGKAPPKPIAARQRRDKKEQKKRKLEERRQKAFADYFNYSEEVKRIPPHRILAINRGERARVLRVKLECDMEALGRTVDEVCVPAGHPHADFLRGCARDALVRLILPSLERDLRRELTERAETHAVTVFARNLRNLLLQPPVRDRRVLAIDPGYKSGCKLAALDQFGNVLGHDLIYLVGKPERREEARRIVAEMVQKHEISVVATGNGTACRDTEDFVADLLGQELKDKGVSYVVVNEAGASVYSTSRIGREEFPNYDATLRGAVSIGRRLQDPLSELVKIEPANLGVGLYQHDVKAKHLQESLDEVVESSVNYVGVDVNTASPALLRYVSGLNQLTARRLYEYRLEHGPFRNRQQLKEVPGIGEATFVQAAGFLKIAGDNPLDATSIHPESYEIAGRVLATLDGTPADLGAKETAAARAERLGKIEVDALAQALQVGTMTLRDIIAQLARPGRDPREDLPPPVFKRGVLKLEDLSPGMELTGTVLNVVDFGAFVDIGMHDSGLVHVSQLADRFVRDPYEVISVGDIVKVWVLEVDKQRRRVSLTMIPPGHARATGRRHGKPEDRAKSAEPAKPVSGPRPEGRTAPEGQARAQGQPPSGPPRRPDRPRFERRPPSSGQAPRRDYGPPKPRPRPRPITPITDDMKAGKEPLRSFSDLMQFYDIQRPGPAKDKPEKPVHQGPKGKDRQREPAGPPEPTEAGAPSPEAAGRPPVPEVEAPPQETDASPPAAPPLVPSPPAEAPPASLPAATSPSNSLDRPTLREGMPPDTLREGTPSDADTHQTQPPRTEDQGPIADDRLPETPAEGD